MLWLCSCGTPKEVFVTPDFESNNRTTEIIPYYKSNYLPKLLGYETFSDSVRILARKDSTTPFTFIFSDTSIMEMKMETIMEFGDSAGKCTIHYGTYSKTLSANPGALDILINKNVKDEVRLETYVYISGTIEYPEMKTPARFGFSSDSRYLVIGTDSFSLQPLYQGKWKAMRTYIGVQLLKGETVYGVICTLTGVFRHNAFLYTRASQTEQLLIAAYFAVIARFV